MSHLGKAANPGWSCTQAGDRKPQLSGNGCRWPMMEPVPQAPWVRPNALALQLLLALSPQRLPRRKTPSSARSQSTVGGGLFWSLTLSYRRQ